MKKLLKLSMVMVLFCAIIYACQKERGTKHELSQKSTEVQNNILGNLEKNLTEAGMNFRHPTSEEIKAKEELGSCAPGGGSVGACLELFVTDTISVPPNGSSPGCNSVQVTYTVRVCSDFTIGKLVLTYSDFDAVPLDCGDLIQYWLSVPNEDLTEVEATFIAQASMIAENNFTINSIKHQEATCPNDIVENKFYTGLCYQLCLNIHSKGTEGFNEYQKRKVLRGDDPDIFRLFKRVPCGRRCCLRSRGACLDDNGQVVFSKPTFKEIGEPCGSSPITVECSGTLVGDCDHGCKEK